MNDLKLAKPEVEIELGGRVRLLKFDFWALSLVEEECGLAFLGGKITTNKLIILTWAGLLAHDPTLEAETKAERKQKLRIVGDWIFERQDLAGVTEKIVEALQNSFGKSDAEEGAKNESAGEESPG